MPTYNTTPIFDKDYSSFTSIEKSDIKKLKDKIKLGPFPPETDDWKTLHQFDNDYPDGIVCAHRINHFDRLTYELNITTGDITFTNCRGHKWRKRSYSDNLNDLRRTFSEIRNACITKEQKLAFNHLLNTFKFK